jgi:acetamidase/formamidase
LANHKLDRSAFHYLWSGSHKPVLEIESGDSVWFEINEVMSGQISPKTSAKDLLKVDFSKVYPLTGPVHVKDASAGDALRVSVEAVEPANWGWSAIMPGFGVLPEFDKPYLKIWNFSSAKKEGYVHFKDKIRVPYRPFCGVMGVAPKEDGEFQVMPPGRHGGNMDIRHLVKGGVLDLPVWRKGALFSVGDLHAGQGDGEVCVSAMECPGRAKFKFELIEGVKLSSPRYSTPRKRSVMDSEFATLGIGPDLMEASRGAVRNMIDYLRSEHGLSREEAYVLCSVAADLRIHEVVDAPNWVVGLAISKSVLAI